MPFVSNDYQPYRPYLYSWIFISKNKKIVPLQDHDDLDMLLSFKRHII